jgi:signal peptidase I
MTIVRKLGNVVFGVLTVVLLAVGILLASGQLPFRIYAVQSGSMSPDIPTRSAVLVHTERDYAPGDVIAFNVGDNVTTHRLLEIEPDGTYVTKGDAVEQVDPFPITEADVIGKVVGTVPELGYWLVYLQQPVGMFSVIAGGIALWLIWSVAADLGRDPEQERDIASGGDDPADDTTVDSKQLEGATAWGPRTTSA